MTQVFPGRYTAHIDEPFVVFLIGLRVNQPFRFRKWLPVAQAMAPMVQELYDNPELGFLGAENFFRLFPITTLMLSYWRSFDHLEQYSRNKDHEHLPAWRKFNQAIGTDGSVGIWHETYLVSAGQYETVYGNMPKFGLGLAFDHVSAVGRRETARRRLGGESEPGVPSPETSDT